MCGPSVFVRDTSVPRRLISSEYCAGLTVMTILTQLISTQAGPLGPSSRISRGREEESYLTSDFGNGRCGDQYRRRWRTTPRLPQGRSAIRPRPTQTNRMHTGLGLSRRKTLRKRSGEPRIRDGRPTQPAAGRRSSRLFDPGHFGNGQFGS